MKNTARISSVAAFVLAAFSVTLIAGGCAGGKVNAEPCCEPATGESPAAATPVASEPEAVAEAETSATAAPATEPAATETPAPEAKTAAADKKPAPEISRWDGSDWRKYVVWPYESASLQREAAEYAKDKYLSGYLKGASVRVTINEGARTGVIAFHRGAGKSVLNVFFTEDSPYVTHYFTR